MTRKKGPKTDVVPTTSVFTFVSFVVVFSLFFHNCKCYALLVVVPKAKPKPKPPWQPSSFAYSKLQIRRRRMEIGRSQKNNEMMITKLCHRHNHSTTTKNVDDDIMLLCLEEEEDQDNDDEEKEAEEGNNNKLFLEYLKNKVIDSMVVGLFTTMMSSICFLSLPSPSFAAATTTSTSSPGAVADPQCFINKCGMETQRVFTTSTSIISNIQGLACLGGCPENDQMCSTRCFAKFATPELNQWLTCTIETNKCIQFPPPSSTSIDNNSSNNNNENSKSLHQIPLLILAVKEKGYNNNFPNIIRSSFQQSTLINNGKTWYKTHGLNPNYDLYSCQSYTFDNNNSKISKEEEGHDSDVDTGGNSNHKDITLNMAMNFRVVEEDEGDYSIERKYWETIKTEPFLLHNIINDNDNNNNKNNVLIGQISGQFYGLHYNEDWYLIGEAAAATTTTTMEDVTVDDENNNNDNDTSPSSSKVLLIAYKGHTIRGDYYGSFVLTDNEQRVLTTKAELAVQKLAKDVHLNLNDYSLVDNHCPN